MTAFRKKLGLAKHIWVSHKTFIFVNLPCCVTRIFLGRHSTHVYSPQLGNTKQTDTTKTQQMYRNMGEVSPIGEEMTQRLQHHQKSTEAWMTAHKSCEPGAHYTLSWRLSSSKPLPGNLTGSCFFQAAGLVSESSLQLDLSERDSGKFDCWLLEGGA